MDPTLSWLDELGTRDGIACEDSSGRTLTFRELDDASAHLAEMIAAAGAVSVAVSLDRSVDQLVAFVACLRAGAAYVPVDRDLPVARVRAILADARPAVAFADKVTAALLVEAGVTTIVIPPS